MGGILVGLAKMCIKGNKGINIKKPDNLVNYFEYFFGEDQGRYLIEIEKKKLKKYKVYSWKKLDIFWWNWNYPGKKNSTKKSIKYNNWRTN